MNESVKSRIIGNATLYLGDCMDILPTLGKVDAVVTDPPYPDYHAEEYMYFDGILDFLKSPDCRQLIFWSIKSDFPLNFTARHVWDKKMGCGSEYEFIFERNGKKNFKVFNAHSINSWVSACMCRDVWTGHKSQKPIALIKELVGFVKGDTILDPFMGSGTTGVACYNMGRRFIGIEKNEKYFDIACKRIELANAQGQLDFEGGGV
ncbi:hypothetical protein AGMMS49991_11830 [Spirochaetia bacterium]|nr:hypothetical protein AGMMS49991_11830 [Spirochaetia bacterium]